MLNHNTNCICNLCLHRENMGPGAGFVENWNLSLHILDKVQHHESYLIYMTAMIQLLVLETITDENNNKTMKLIKLLESFAKPPADNLSGFLNWNQNIRRDLLNGNRVWDQMMKQRNFNETRSNVLPGWTLELSNEYCLILLL